jgi:putative ABC transport system substrate-binding protein
MRRRDFITLFGSAAAGWPLAARAQQSDRMRSIGWLEQAQPDDPAGQARIMAVRKDLEQLGWIVGRNLQIDCRWALSAPRWHSAWAGSC